MSKLDVEALTAMRDDINTIVEHPFVEIFYNRHCAGVRCQDCPLHQEPPNESRCSIDHIKSGLRDTIRKIDAEIDRLNPVKSWKCVTTYCDDTIEVDGVRYQEVE